MISLLKTALAAALAIATFTLALLTFLALDQGGKAGPVRIAAGYYQQSIAALDVRPVTAANLARARAADDAALQLTPVDTGIWLRRAYADGLAHGRLTQEGARALKRSYDLAAIDPQVAIWRIGFALDHWRDLPVDVQTLVRKEFDILMTEKVLRYPMKTRIAAVKDPTVRLMATFWIARYVKDF